MGSRKDGEEQRHDERLDIDEGTKKVLDLLIAERIAYLQEKRKKEQSRGGAAGGGVDGGLGSAYKRTGSGTVRGERGSAG